MNILIVGLGIIGASYAKGLKIKGHYIYGVDKLESTLKYAKDNNIIDEGSLNACDFIDNADLIILGLYPNNLIQFLKEHKFKASQIITDVCGVKSHFLEEAYELAKPATYISHHPMAGREKVGIEYSDNKIFDGANFLIINYNNKDYEINALKEIAKDLNFGKISIISMEKHDKMIGYTSQLAHAIAVALVNSDTEEDTFSFIGDSYRDLTRIAKINKNLWSELFLSNKDYLIDEIDNFEKVLNDIKTCLINDDSKKLKEIFEESKIRREKMEK